MAWSKADAVREEVNTAYTAVSYLLASLEVANVPDAGELEKGIILESGLTRWIEHAQEAHDSIRQVMSHAAG